MQFFCITLAKVAGWPKMSIKIEKGGREIYEYEFLFDLNSKYKFIIKMRDSKKYQSKYNSLSLSFNKQISHNQSSLKDPLSQNRRFSLPSYAKPNTINMRNSIQVPSADIYFNVRKKSKFMKSIVDNYFEDTLQRIYETEQDVKHKQSKFFQKNRKIMKKGSKFLINSILTEESRRQMHEEGENKSLSKSPPKQQQEQLTESHYLNKSLSSNGNLSSLLPPIYELQEDYENFATQFPQMNETIIANIKNESTSQKLIFQNEAFRIFVIFVGSKPKYRIKQYKFEGREIMKREQKAEKFDVNKFWEESRINTNVFIGPLVRPLKSLICRIILNQGSGTGKFKVTPTSYRKNLIQNNCSQLRILIRQICNQLRKVEDKVLNNKINPSNIFILKQSRVCIAEWGCSSFREQYKIQENKYESRVNPILKTSLQWLTTPEYLSPELLCSMLSQEQKQVDIWKYKSSSDIWSFGLTLFEILTMIPIWMPELCQKSNSKKPILRAGLLGTPDRKIQRIMQKQARLQKNVKQCLHNELEDEVSSDIISLITRMVVYDPSKRISLDEIISIVK